MRDATMMMLMMMVCSVHCTKERTNHSCASRYTIDHKMANVRFSFFRSLLLYPQGSHYTPRPWSVQDGWCVRIFRIENQAARLYVFYCTYNSNRRGGGIHISRAITNVWIDAAIFTDVVPCIFLFFFSQLRVVNATLVVRMKSPRQVYIVHVLTWLTR